MKHKIINDEYSENQDSEALPAEFKDSDNLRRHLPTIETLYSNFINIHLFRGDILAQDASAACSETSSSNNGRKNNESRAKL